MAPNLANIPDHYLWLGLGVFTFFAIKQVSQSLLHIRDLTRIHNPSPHPITTLAQKLPSSPTHQEDAIKTSSLLILATSPNIDIRASATKILCQRFYASNTAKKLLVKDMNSKDPEIKHRAQLAYNLLYDSGVIPLPMRPNGPREGWRVHEAPAPVLAGGEGAGARGNGQDASGEGGDDQDLRRRRREAVVIHDGPVGQGDQFMGDQAVFDPGFWNESWDDPERLREILRWDAEEFGTF